MVCYPFHDSKFCETKTIFRYLMIDTLLCFFIANKNIVQIINMTANFFDAEQILLNHADLQKTLEFANGVKLMGTLRCIITEVGYLIAVAKLALKTQKSLHESEKMGNKSPRDSLHRRIFYFTLMPLVVNLAYMFPQVIRILDINRVIGVHKKCIEMFFLMRGPGLTCLTTCIFSVSSFGYLP